MSSESQHEAQATAKRAVTQCLASKHKGSYAVQLACSMRVHSPAALEGAATPAPAFDSARTAADRATTADTSLCLANDLRGRNCCEGCACMSVGDGPRLGCDTLGACCWSRRRRYCSIDCIRPSTTDGASSGSCTSEDGKWALPATLGLGPPSAQPAAVRSIKPGSSSFNMYTM